MLPRRGPGSCRAWVGSGHLAGPPQVIFWHNLRYVIIRHWQFVPCNSENISCTTFLKYKNSRKQELTLWHLVNRLVPKSAKYYIKVHIKHVRIKTKQAWSIKNYRYVCNVSGLPIRWERYAEGLDKRGIKIWSSDVLTQISLAEGAREQAGMLDGDSRTG